MAKINSVWIVEVHFKNYDTHETSVVGIYTSQKEADKVKNNWWDFFNHHDKYRKGFDYEYTYIYEFDQIICYEKSLNQDLMLEVLTSRPGDETINLAKTWRRDLTLDDLLH